jgi:ABC-type sugar transport system substrate-binding protein
VYAETEIDGETFYAEYRLGIPGAEIAYGAIPAIKIAGEDGAAGLVLFHAQDEIRLIAGGTLFAFVRLKK